MTSFAFIFGCLPLWGADGAGAAARRMLGTTVVAGMSAATLLGIFFVPALFVFVERLGGHKDAHAVASPARRRRGAAAGRRARTAAAPGDGGRVECGVASCGCRVASRSSSSSE